MTVIDIGQSKLDKVIAQIIKLTDMANHPDTLPAEADLARAKAESMLVRYNVEEAWLEKVRPAERQVPVMKQVPIYPYSSGMLGDTTYMFSDLFQVLARHCGVKVNDATVFDTIELDDGETMKYRMFRVVGYESDVRYLEVLFASLRLHISTNISPQWNANESLEENVARLHEAGVGYPRMAELAVKAGYPQFNRGRMIYTPKARRMVGELDKSATAKLMRVYDKYCRRTGRRKTLVHSPANYRTWFLSGYTNMIRARVKAMQEMKANTLQTIDQESGNEGGAELALRDRGDVVDEAFYNFFPELRPSTEPLPPAAFKTKRRRGGPGSRGGRVRGMAYNDAAVAAGSRVAKTADLSGGRNNIGTRKALES